MYSEPFLVRDGERESLGNLEKSVRSELLVEWLWNVLLRIVKQCQKDTIRMRLWLVGDSSRVNGVERVDDETLMEFVKPGYVIEGVLQSYRTMLGRNILFNRVQHIVEIYNNGSEQLCLEVGNI